MRPRGCAVVVALVGVGTVAAGLLFGHALGLVGARAPGARTHVTVPEGASAADIGRLLEARGVVPSALGFRVAAFLEGSGDALQAGRYRLPRNLTARAAVGLLARGPEPPDFVTVTFPEGSWLVDFARILGEDTHLSARRFLRLARSGRVRSRLQPPATDTLEGLLFPSTYQVIRRERERSLLRRLVGEFEDRMERIDLGRVEEMGYGPYQAVIVASMVEAEAKVPSDRTRIAAVIYNRLARGMKLGIDATVSYALGEHKRSLTAEDLSVDSPYNTRRYPGLPPTPIGAPGLESLRAAASPAPGAWLYFVVADCDGRHAFSTSYDQFLADKAAYQALDC